MRRQHYRIFWIKEFDRLLQNLEEKEDSERFKDAVRSYLNWELALHFLPQLASGRGDDAYIAILTYYSTFFSDPRFSDPPRETHNDFIRVPVTSLSLTFPRGENSEITEKHWKLIQQADAAARKCLTGHLPLEGVQTTPDGDARQREELAAFLELIQKDVLAPVNLAEALNVDFHLPPAHYKGIVDELLFSSLSGLDGQAAARAKAKALMHWAGLEETTASHGEPDAARTYDDDLLDRPLFTKESVSKAREVIRYACDRLQECRQREQISSGVLLSSTKIMEELVGELTFEFAPPTGAGALTDGARLDEQSLYKLPLRLLGYGDDAPARAVSLKKLWEDRVDEKFGEWPADYRLMLLPALPFFLLALYWNGTYRHLIQFILPGFLLDFDELHVETIDLCGEPPDLLYQLCCYLLALKAESKLERETLPDNVSRMIRKNAIGNLVLLRKLSGEGEGDTAKRYAGFNLFEWIERLDMTVRSALSPIRRRERYAEFQREIASTKRNERALAERLHNAYSRLSQDLSTIDDSMHKFSRRLESLAPPSMGDDPQALSMTKSLREVIRAHKSNMLEAAIALEEKKLCRYLHPASLPANLFEDGGRFSEFIDEVKKEFEEGLWDYLSPDERAEFTTNPQWSFNAIKTLISNAEDSGLSDLKSTLGRLLDMTGLKGKFRPDTGQVLWEWLSKSNRSLAEQVIDKLQELPEGHVTFFYKDGLTKLQELIKTPSHLEVVQYVEGGLRSNIISITQRHQEGDGEKADKGLLYCDEKDALDWFRGRPRQSHLYKIFLLLSSYGPLLFERYNETGLKPSAEPYMAVRMQHPYIEALSGLRRMDIRKEFGVEPLDRRAEELGQAIRFSFLFWTKTQ